LKSKGKKTYPNSASCPKLLCLPVGTVCLWSQRSPIGSVWTVGTAAQIVNNRITVSPGSQEF